MIDQYVLSRGTEPIEDRYVEIYIIYIIYILYEFYYKVLTQVIIKSEKFHDLSQTAIFKLDTQESRWCKYEDLRAKELV